MPNMLKRLSKLEQPIRVGIIGAGAMGKGLLYQCSITPGMRCVGISDIDTSKAIDALNSLGIPNRQIGSPEGMREISDTNLAAACIDSQLLIDADHVDVIIEATSSILEGAQYVIKALQVGKTVVLMNSEIDLAFRPYFDQIAVENDTVCSSIDGDQYGVISHLIDDMHMWGFQLVLAGNIKGFLNRQANPTNIIAEADQRNLDYRMCTAYTDGSKLNVEMALVANTYGLRCDIPGMNGLRAVNVGDALRSYDLNTFRNNGAVVDYIIGAEPGGGVFAIGYHEHPYQQYMLNYYKMGHGPYYLFYRPYHLCHIEAMESVARAYLDNNPLLAPVAGYQTEVYAYAKHNLKIGEYLDGLGGYTCYGQIDNSNGQWQVEGVPICLSDKLRLKRSVRGGQPVMLQDVDWLSSSDAFQLYAKSREAGRRVSSPTKK